MTLNYNEWPKEDLEEEIGCISMPGWAELENEFGGVVIDAIDVLGQNASVLSVIKKCEEIENKNSRNKNEI